MQNIIGLLVTFLTLAASGVTGSDFYSSTSACAVNATYKEVCEDLVPSRFHLASCNFRPAKTSDGTD